MMRPVRLIALAATVLCAHLASTRALATVFTRDGTIALDAAQIGNSSDGENPGKDWEGFLAFPSPVTITAGDTLQGSVSFGAHLLRLRDNGGGFFKVGAVTGYEQLIASAEVDGPAQVSNTDAAAYFNGVRGPAMQTGASRVGGINFNGLFIQVVLDMVSAGQDIFTAGVVYRLGLVSGGPFTFDGVELRVLAEDIGIEQRSPGDHTYRDCITGETETGPATPPPGSGACLEIPGAASNGENSGLNNLRSVATTADGTSLYAVAANDDAVARFARNPSNGNLTYQGCITGETESGPTGTSACTQISSAASLGTNSGLDTLQSVALSPDGKSLYVVSVLDDAVARFERNVTTGALTYQGCISGETESGPTGTNACTLIDSAAPSGTNSGLDAVRSVAVSADGTSVYVASESDDAVARFARNLSTGALTYLGCISGETQSGPSGTDACTLVPSATPDGANSGLDALQSLAVSADGASVYAVSLLDDAVARFDRNPTTGALTYQSCLTGESLSGTACTAVGSATMTGANSGLDELFSLTLSADGRSLYAASESDDAVARFDRNVTTGALTYRGCITGETESGPTGTNGCVQIAKATPGGTDSGLDKLRSVAVSAGGTSLYAGSPADDAVARFERNPTTGALGYEACITGETQSGPTGTNACAQIASATSFGISSGLDNPQSITVSTDERSLYAASGNDAAVARFDLEPPLTTTTTTFTTTTSTTQTTSTTLTVNRIGGKKLLLTDNRNVAKRKILFVSNDPSLDTSPAGIDPVTNGAFFHVFNEASGDSACFTLPAGGWMKRKPANPIFKYKDKRFANGACKAAMVKDGKLLTVACVAKVRPITYSLDEPAQGSVAVRFGSGSTEYCTLFGGTVTKDKQNKKFLAKNAPPPSACPVAPVACP